jgi:hypothetical protein
MVPHNAAWVIYFPFELEEDDYDLSYELFQEMVSELRDSISDMFPSFAFADSWIGREEHAILENGLGQIVLCEYMGLCSLSFVPTGEREGLSLKFAEQIKPKIEKQYARLRFVARFSNGEAMYEHIRQEATA